ncbi:uncharacterized protein J3D65DRAFT_608807 [Phyllosticta citribraziliensis]|uniref:Uncharacterized protein n=1 Tax=Phyllosticta citribraziliensis TaxID=989973 RepID=A0ABR1MA59_9PEZI
MLPVVAPFTIRLEKCSRQPHQRSSHKDVLSADLGRSSRCLHWLVVVDAGSSNVGWSGGQRAQNGTASSIGRCEGGRGARSVIGHASSSEVACANKVAGLFVSVAVPDEAVGAVWNVGPGILLVAHAINVSLLKDWIIISVPVVVVVVIVVATTIPRAVVVARAVQVSITVAVDTARARELINIWPSVPVNVQRAVAEEVNARVRPDLSSAVGEDVYDWLALAAAVSGDVIPVQVCETQAHKSEERDDCDC